jgi:hypothetical protein
MKKATLILALVLSFSVSKAQVIDTLVKSITAVRITPVKASFQDTVNSVFLGAYVVSDNLSSSATFYWCLLQPTTDSTGAIIGAGKKTSEGNFTMSGDDYTKWCSTEPCSTWPFTLIAQAYGLTFPASTNKK